VSQNFLDRLPPVAGEILAIKNSGDFLKAAAMVRRLIDQYPMALASEEFMSALLACPECFDRDGQVDEYFEFLDSVMTRICDLIAVATSPLMIGKVASVFLKSSNFRIATHNEFNLKPFMMRRTAIFSTAMRCSGFQLDYDFPPALADRKIRYGILFKHGVADPETTSILPFFEHIDRNRFEISLLTCRPVDDTDFGRYLLKLADRHVVLGESLAANAAAIRSLDLDFLMFGGDITAKPSMMNFLSFFKLARKSMTGVCALCTTGGAQVDFYFTGNYYKARGFDAEFTEQCLAVNDVGFGFSFQESRNIDDESPELYSRAQLAGDSSVVLTSGANFSKLHPELLKAWATILAACPEACLVLYPFPPHYGYNKSAIVSHILRHFSVLGDGINRVKLLDSIPGRQKVMQVIRHADLALDSFPYPGVTTIVDTVEAGVPIVSLEGRTLRSSQSASILRSLGLGELLARDTNEYIEKAVALIHDTETLRGLKAKVSSALQGTPAIYDTQAIGKRVDTLLQQEFQKMLPLD
jgi:predicted O-linked N-acetylglucosamine transferase (SPINDLY family)